MKLHYWALIIFLGALWGCSFLFNAILIRELGPIWVSAGRISIGALGCWAYFIVMRKTLPTEPRVYFQLLVLGMMNYGIPFMLFPYAEQSLASGLVGVLNGLTPMTTVLVSQFWPGGEKATWNKSIGVGIGFVGAAILASPSMGGTAEILPILACLLASFCYAFTLNYSRRFKGVDSAAVASTSLTGAALIMVPLAFLVHGTPVITRPETWAALLAIGLLSSSLAFLLLWWLVPRVGATNVSLNTFITPISAILLGVLVLHERFELVHVIGIIVIFFGLVFIDGRLVKRFMPQPKTAGV